MQTKACIACAKARRKCGKQIPQCIRCRAKGLSCRYTPVKLPANFVALLEAPSPTLENASCHVPQICSPIQFHLDQTASWWFASPETWEIDPAPAALTASQRFTTADLRRLLDTTIAWLKQWVDTGSNPFVHAHLYRYHLPICIQDAFLSLSCYFQRTPANEHMVFRIMEERILRLVADGVPHLTPMDARKTTDAPAKSAIEYLAHIQALLVYQCVGFYDGNVRLRYLAEQHMPVLESWLMTFMEHNSRGVCCGESLINALDTDCSSAVEMLGYSPRQYFLWYAWILAETTRRTWLIAVGIQGIYRILQTGTASCMGAPLFTSRYGFWEAPSADKWEKKCSEMWAGQVRLTEVDVMLEQIPREELSDFAKVVLQFTYGPERMQQWGLIL